MIINPAPIDRLDTKGRTAWPLNTRTTSSLLLPILLLLTTLAHAADASGKWNGSLEFKGEDGQTQTATVHADLKQQANGITGKVWKEDGKQFEIEQGQVNGNEISFIFRAPEGEDEQVLVHSVRLTLVAPTQLQGTLEFEVEGQKVTGKLAFSREK